MNLILRSPDQTKCEGGKPVKTRKVPSRQTPPAATSDKKPGAKRCGVSGLDTTGPGRGRAFFGTFYKAGHEPGSLVSSTLTSLT